MEKLFISFRIIPYFESYGIEFDLLKVISDSLQKSKYFLQYDIDTNEDFRINVHLIQNHSSFDEDIKAYIEAFYKNGEVILPMQEFESNFKKNDQILKDLSLKIINYLDSNIDYLSENVFGNDFFKDFNLQMILFNVN
ncbi:MAG: hypothetical protein WC872_00760 [Candidatus Absconditabacterales bacterium]|jgi:hypothetical protein